MFGATSGSEVIRGIGQQSPSQPAANPFGQPASTFGAASAPFSFGGAFGQAQAAPAFGAAQPAPAFGAPTFGQAAKPSFGSSAPAFSATSAPSLNRRTKEIWTEKIMMLQAELEKERRKNDRLTITVAVLDKEIQHLRECKPISLVINLNPSSSSDPSTIQAPEAKVNQSGDPMTLEERVAKLESMGDSALRRLTVDEARLEKLEKLFINDTRDLKESIEAVLKAVHPQGKEVMTVEQLIFQKQHKQVSKLVERIMVLYERMDNDPSALLQWMLGAALGKGWERVVPSSVSAAAAPGLSVPPSTAFGSYGVTPTTNSFGAGAFIVAPAASSFGSAPIPAPSFRFVTAAPAPAPSAPSFGFGFGAAPTSAATAPVPSPSFGFGSSGTFNSVVGLTEFHLNLCSQPLLSSNIRLILADYVRKSTDLITSDAHDLSVFEKMRPPSGQATGNQSQALIKAENFFKAFPSVSSSNFQSRFVPKDPWFVSFLDKLRDAGLLQSVESPFGLYSQMH